MPNATVKEFDPAKGFGTLTLPGGDELIFDIAIANVRTPLAGDRCEVEIGVGWKGRPKATRVTFAATGAGPATQQVIEQLRAFGLFQHWSRATAREVPATMSRRALGALMRDYYGAGPSERGRAEGVITLDARYRDSSSDVVRDICAICPESLAIDFEPGDDLGELVTVLNQILVERGSAYRYYRLDVDAPFYVIVCHTLDFEAQLATSGWLAVR